MCYLISSSIWCNLIYIQIIKLSIIFCSVLFHSHLLKRRMRMTMLIMKMTARTGPTTQRSPSSSSMIGCGSTSENSTASENGLVEYTVCQSKIKNVVLTIVFAPIFSVECHNSCFKNKQYIIISFTKCFKLNYVFLRNDLLTIWLFNTVYLITNLS